MKKNLPYLNNKVGGNTDPGFRTFHQYSGKGNDTKYKDTSQQDLLIHPKERKKNHFVTLYTDNTYNVLYTYYISFYTRKIYIKM